MICTLTINTLVDGEKESGVVHSILPYGADYNPSEYVSDANGTCVIELDYDTYIIQSTYENGYTTSNLTIDLNEETFRLDISLVKEETEEDITEEITDEDLDECNKVLLDKSCKYFHHDPYMTPNNYDLYFDYKNIPVNIITESPANLHKRLQRYLPLTKILHLNLETNDESKSNVLNVYSSVNLKYNTTKINDTNNFFYPTVSMEWNNSLLNELLKDRTYYLIYDKLQILLDYLELSYELEDTKFNNFITSIMLSVGDETKLEYSDVEVNGEIVETIETNSDINRILEEILDSCTVGITDEQYSSIGEEWCRAIKLIKDTETEVTFQIPDEDYASSLSNIYDWGVNNGWWTGTLEDNVSNIVDNSSMYLFSDKHSSPTLSSNERLRLKETDNESVIWSNNFIKKDFIFLEETVNKEITEYIKGISTGYDELNLFYRFHDETNNLDTGFLPLHLSWKFNIRYSHPVGETIPSNSVEEMLYGMNMLNTAKNDFYIDINKKIKYTIDDYKSNTYDVTISASDEVIETVTLLKTDKFIETLSNSVPIYPVFSSGELDYTTKIEYIGSTDDDMRIFTCDNCGKMYYIDSISTCDYCTMQNGEAYSFTEQMPYILSVTNFTDSHLEEHNYRLL